MLNTILCNILKVSHLYVYSIAQRSLLLYLFEYNSFNNISEFSVEKFQSILFIETTAFHCFSFKNCSFPLPSYKKEFLV